MEWIPADYGGTRMMMFQQDRFWSPDVEVISMTHNEYQSSWSQFVQHDGTVLAIGTSINAKLSCKFDVRNFPFDEHTCNLLLRQRFFGTDTYRLSYPNALTDDKPQMMLQNYVENDQWELVKPVEMEAGFAKLITDTYHLQNYKIHIRRVPDFYLRVLIYPTLVVYVLSVLTFCLPFESGEKVSLSITILLAQFVNLLVLSDSIPQSSVNFPVFGIFLLMSIVFVGFTVVVSVITLNLYYKSSSSSPPWLLRKLLYSRFAWFVGGAKLQRSRKLSNFTGKIGPIHESNKDDAPTIDPISENVIKVEAMVCEPDKNEETQQEWQLIALIIDRCCGCIYVIFGVAAIILCNPLQI